MGTDPGSGAARDLPADEPVSLGDRVREDTAEADMLRAVLSGSVIYSKRGARSGWTSPLDAGGFTHIGHAESAAWTPVEQEALDNLVEWGLVMVRHQMHWVLTPDGRTRALELVR